MKRTYIIFLLLIGILLVLFGYYTGKSQVLTVFLSAPSFPSYGQSPYGSTINSIKISVEKIVKEKYFITYSWSIGNESYFGISLLVEHQNKEPLSKDNFRAIWFIDDQGFAHYPIPYFEILDFPKDKPLGWKQVINCKFWPLERNIKRINLYIKYSEDTFIIKDIDVE